MEILFPEPRTPKRHRSWMVVALLCVPSLLAWAVIGLDWSGLWRTADPLLHNAPTLARAAVMLASPLAAVAIGVVGLARRSRAGETFDPRLFAVTVVGVVLAVVTASAAWLHAS
jgi:purine-cytosine permease-like protein